MRILSFFISSIIALSVFADDVYTIIANPGENASNSVRINWHSDIDAEKTHCFYIDCNNSDWSKAKKVKAKQELCTAYDSMYSKTPKGENFYESARFMRNTVELKKLSPDSKYMYRIGATPNEGEIRYFHTAPKSGDWTAAIISDIHTYTPLPKRVEAAMGMIKTLEQRNGEDFDMILHVGDIIAWGGSYSFWRDLYSNEPFKKYMWAGVNGNHDNMDRTNKKNSNNFFRYANNNPQNGYKGEKGVCYHFTYGDVLFIMLNNQVMRSDDGLATAQEWVKKVIRKNKRNTRFTVVIEHYPWFFGGDGRTSQYARWNKFFDENGVDLAISAHNHIYLRTNAIYNDKETDGSIGTVYMQTPSSDNERGETMHEWTDNKDKIKFRWCEGAKTVGAILLKASSNNLSLTLYDRNGTALDNVNVKAKQR